MSTPLTFESIMAAVEKVRAEGWMVKQGVWVDHGGPTRCCCPLGACLLDADPLAPNPMLMSALPGSAQVADKLGIHRDWSRGFSEGFDGNLPIARYGDRGQYLAGHSLGVRVREATMKGGA